MYGVITDLIIRNAHIVGERGLKDTGIEGSKIAKIGKIVGKAYNAIDAKGN